MARPIIALLTDFGPGSLYVGVLKGVIAGINPDARVIDLGHDVRPQAIQEAAYLLESGYRYLPRRTVVVVVVDPGVGSARRPILALGEHCDYVAPDNGVLSYVLESDAVQSVYELNQEHYWKKPLSATFHGRDMFAPIGAWRSLGIEPENLGDPIQDVRRFALPRPRVEGSQLHGEVLLVDRFGNLVTNIERPMLSKLMAQVQQRFGSGGFRVAVGGQMVEPFVETYAQAQSGAMVSLIGSSERLELSEVGGNAAQTCSASVGASVTVQFYQSQGRDPEQQSRYARLAVADSE